MALLILEKMPNKFYIACSTRLGNKSIKSVKVIAIFKVTVSNCHVDVHSTILVNKREINLQL